MKKLIYLFVITFTITSCSNKSETSMSVLIEKKNIDGLKILKEDKIKVLNNLKIELTKINEAIIELSPNEKLPLITSSILSPENFDHYIEIQGNVQTRKNILIFPEFSGILKEVYVKEGEIVNKGEILAQIDDAGLKSQLEQLQIQAALSKTTYERTQRLWNQNIGSEMQLIQAKTVYESDIKNIARLKKQLQRTQIIAPFSGTIDEIVANTGANLIPGQTPVLRVVNLNEMYVEAKVPESYVSQIKVGADAIVEIPILGKKYSTKIRQTGNFINPNNRSFRVEAALSNPDKIIKPNLTCKLKIKDYNNPEALMIPLGVIKENSTGEKYIFKLIPSNKEDIYETEQVFVKLGKKSINKVEVISGVEAGSLYVNEGSGIVENNQRVKDIK